MLRCWRRRLVQGAAGRNAWSQGGPGSQRHSGAASETRSRFLYHSDPLACAGSLSLHGFTDAFQGPAVGVALCRFLDLQKMVRRSPCPESARGLVGNNQSDPKKRNVLPWGDFK